MVTFPPCKINLGLSILSKRPDGYHNIETCFYPVPWTDIFEVIQSDRFIFTVSGPPVSGSEGDNLCVRAYSLLKKDFGIPPVQMHLHKIIPSGAGLGGGSSDAAATLNTLNEIFSLGISVDGLRLYASQLGSDCAFFIEPRPMLGSGRGEILTMLPLKLSGKILVLVNPDIHVSTAEAYSAAAPWKPVRSITKTLGEPVTEWREKLVNDFEASVFMRHPSLLLVKQRFYELGALFASMSGSGSSVFGLFDKEIDTAKAFSGMRVWSGVLP